MNSQILSKHTPIPLYYQLAEWIREQVQSGQLAPGDQLPSERELCEQAGVSRMTARQAVAYLAREGVLTVRAGVGTFVAEPKLTHDALHLLGFSEQMMRQGGRVTSTVLEQAVVMPPAAAAAALELAPGERVVKIARLRHADQVPLLLETSILPLFLCAGLEEEELASHSLYTVLAERYGLHLHHAHQTFQATVANEYERQLFGVGPGTPMILLEGITYTGHGRPAEYFKALYRGDRFKFTFESQRDNENGAAPGSPVVGIVMKTQTL
ncbi:MAG: GntR family transcriptional regulator [Chloroflexi bacterium]|nr:GntR family transcriptional regulator [Chloroflexota bacterium]